MKPKLKAVKFPKPKVADDTELIANLVDLLDKARNGRVIGYAVAFIVRKDGDDCNDIHVGSNPSTKLERLVLLGAIERLKKIYMEQAWEDD
jgi:hypothetical protein